MKSPAASRCPAHVLETVFGVRGAGLQRVYTIDNDADFDAKLDQHFSEEGPVVFIWKIDKAEEPVPKPSKPIRERAHRLREALTGSA